MDILKPGKEYGRFGRIWGEHGQQPGTTFDNVLPTQNPILEPFKVSFRRISPQIQWLRSRIFGGENVDEGRFRLVAMFALYPAKSSIPFRKLRTWRRLGLLGYIKLG